MTAPLSFVSHEPEAIRVGEWDIEVWATTTFMTYATDGPDGLKRVQINDRSSETRIFAFDCAARGVTDGVVLGGWVKFDTINYGSTSNLWRGGQLAVGFDTPPASGSGAPHIGRAIVLSRSGSTVYLNWLDGSGGSTGGGTVASWPFADFPALTATSWHHWQIHLRRDGSGDWLIDVYYDGAVVIKNETLTDPFDGDPILWAGHAHRATSNAIGSHYHGFWISEDTPLGAALVQTVRPSSQGFHDDMTATGSDKVADLAASPPGSDGAEADLGDVDTYNMGTFTMVSGAPSILAVQVSVTGQSIGVQLDGVVRDNGTDETITRGPVGLVGTPSGSKALSSINPHTSEPWTEADINGAEWGMEAVAP